LFPLFSTRQPPEKIGRLEDENNLVPNCAVYLIFTALQPSVGEILRLSGRVPKGSHTPSGKFFLTNLFYHKQKNNESVFYN